MPKLQLKLKPARGAGPSEGVETEELEKLKERLRSITVNKDGGSSIGDLKRYFRNAPDLKKDVEALKSLQLGYRK